MSHPDRPFPLVINHQTIKQVLDWLLAPAVFAHLRGGWPGDVEAADGGRYRPPVGDLRPAHVARALYAGQKDHHESVSLAVRPRAVSYQGFMKMLAQWQDELLAAVVPHLRAQMRDELPAQWETAGYVVFAGDGSRVALARSESLEAAFAPTRQRRKARQRKGQRRKPRGRGAPPRPKPRLHATRRPPPPSCG